ncbi:MAG TPA: hypothetical protein VH333_02355 [Pseudonocardiaceae bacterium]|jgi:hypothetical protein|nr:hypothetical protein [Pseudonocardiaceae bacterium]
MATNEIDTTKDRIVELFTALCGDPDSVELATGVDSALVALDDLLAA